MPRTRVCGHTLRRSIHRPFTAALLAVLAVGSGCAGAFAAASTSDPPAEAPRAVQSAAAARAVEPGVRRALLIGINRYRAVPALAGSVNDVETMREILTTRYGFGPDHITMLTDEAATRDGIMAAFETLVRETGPNDTVYVHFSGHGSRVEDLSGTQEDHLSETIVPQDGRSGDVRDILDLELAVFLARLRARSAVIVLDSCHSGTATRAIDIRTRSIPQDTRVELYRRWTARAIVPAMSSRFVVLAATASDQQALDGPIDGRYHGFFTYALATSLSRAPSGATLGQVFDGVTQELGRLQSHFGRWSMPEPQLEAPPILLDEPLFTPLSRVDSHAAAAREPRLPWAALLPLTPVRGRLIKAALLGAAPGSSWAVYPPGETEFAPGAALGIAVVERLDGVDAVVRLDSRGKPLDPGSRAISLMPSPAPPRVPVRLLEMSSGQRARVERVLDRDIVKLVGPGEPAQFLADLHGDRIRLHTADGLAVVGEYSSDAPIATEELNRLLDRSAKASEILSLDNAASRLQLSVRVAGRPSAFRRGIAVVADTESPKLRIRKPGEPRTRANSLQLAIRSNADVYLTIVDVDSGGGINLLFPNLYQSSSYLPGGRIRASADEDVFIPDSLESGNGAGFHWDYGPPPGLDTVRVFATSDLATATLIRERIKSLQREGDGSRALAPSRAAARRGDSQPQRSGLTVLGSELASVAARGLEGSQGTAADWAAAGITVQIAE